MFASLFTFHPQRASWFHAREASWERAELATGSVAYAHFSTQRLSPEAPRKAIRGPLSETGSSNSRRYIEL